MMYVTGPPTKEVQETESEMIFTDAAATGSHPTWT